MEIPHLCLGFVLHQAGQLPHLVLVGLLSLLGLLREQPGNGRLHHPVARRPALGQVRAQAALADGAIRSVVQGAIQARSGEG